MLFLFTMAELIRDTVFGHFLRIISGGKVLPYEEERDPSLWKRYIDKEKSGRMAHHGHTGEEDENEEQDDNQQHDASRSGSTASSQSGTRVASRDAPHNEISGVRIDSEKGKDVNVVDWFGENDPEVSNLTPTEDVPC